MLRMSQILTTASTPEVTTIHGCLNIILPALAINVSPPPPKSIMKYTLCKHILGTSVADPDP
jgi:hypothetical protein